MNSQEKYIIQQKTRQKYNLLRFMTGLKAIIHRRYARMIAAAYAIIVILVGFYVFSRSNQNADMFEVIHIAIWRLLYPLLVPITTSFLVMLLGTPYGFTGINESLWRAGITNHAGETPLILSKRKAKNSDVVIMEFDSKELVTKIEGELSVIARQGRAFGIHLILATQRPDANILSGQIRNNIDYRVCGRADNVLSMIILDNTDAADRIPKDSQGLFINHNKTIFQGFLFDEREVFYNE